jgi:hypothetical protein
LNPEDAVKGFADRNEAVVNMQASLLSQPFACSGVTGNTYGTKGGGCTIFISNASVIKNGQRSHYKFAAAEDSDALELDGEIWPDPLCGLQGSRLGVIIGDFSQRVFDAKKRCADLTQLIFPRLKTPGLKFAIRSQKSDRFGWQHVAYALGTGMEKRLALKALKKGTPIEWEGWEKVARLENSPSMAKKANDENAKNNKERIFQSNLETDGRKIHIYKLDTAVIGDEEKIARLTEECAKFGTLEQEPGFRPSKDSCAFSWIVYKEEASAQLAMEDDALAAILSEEFATEDIGYVTTEFSYAADYQARKGKVPVVDLTPGGEKAVVLNGAPKEVDKFIAAVLAQQETAAALIRQVVKPVVDEVAKVMKTEGRRISIAVGRQMEPVQKALGEQAQLIAALTEEMAALGNASRKNYRNDSEEPAPHKARRRKNENEVREDPPPSSKTPGKRDRSMGTQAAQGITMGDYETMMTKLLSAQGGEAMISNFMGGGFLKKFRSGSNRRYASEEEEDDEEAGTGL